MLRCPDKDFPLAVLAALFRFFQRLGGVVEAFVKVLSSP